MTGSCFTFSPLVIQFTVFNLAMASFARALRPLARQVMVAAPTRATPRTLMMIAAVHPKRVAVTFPAIQTRGVKTISFAGVPETVYGKHL